MAFSAPEAVAMEKLAIHEKPLHQMNVFVADGTGAAQGAAFHLSSCLLILNCFV